MSFLPWTRPAGELLEAAPKFLFFTGKGGVGKTSLACATAVALADRGKQVLLISTDPASNLDEVLGTTLTGEARSVNEVPGLFALNINPAEAARRYRARLIDPLRGVLPEAVLRTMEEQLSGACTTEIAAFDEFTGFLSDEESVAPYDHVIFDTAPTGHTIRLLQLPGAWTGFLDSNTSGTSCLGPLAGLEKQRAVYARALDALAAEDRTRLILVTRAERSALAEAARSGRELRALGVGNQCLVINALFRATVGKDAAATALQNRAESALAAFSDFLRSLPVFVLPLQERNVLGIPLLRNFFMPPSTPKGKGTESATIPYGFSDPDELIDQIARHGHGVVMTMGKGGVGKTTIASAIAVALASRGHAVTLSTTDPAAHLDTALTAQVPGLRVERIDPAAETSAYREHVLAEQGTGLDPAGLALLEEDLLSPCTEEIAVFRAFAETVARGTREFVVLDTAPTGHTLLLLDASEAYHRELNRQTGSTGSDAIRQLLPRLKDADFTKVVIVTLPESTPIHEAAALQADLRRAEIEPFAWVVNQSFATVVTEDPLVSARGVSEQKMLEEALALSNHMTVRIPWKADEPIGASRLRDLLKAPFAKATV